MMAPWLSVIIAMRASFSGATWAGPPRPPPPPRPPCRPPAGACPAGAGACAKPSPAAPTTPAVPTRKSLRFMEIPLRDIRQNRVVDQSLGGMRADFDRVVPLVADRFGIRDGLADIPLVARLDVHVPRRTRVPALDTRV